MSLLYQNGATDLSANNGNGGRMLASRKFTLTVASLLLISLLTIVGIFWPHMMSLLPTSIGSILAVLGLYVTGNVASKHVITKYLSEGAAAVANPPQPLDPSIPPGSNP
jgi:hypothetical protein